MDAQPPLPAPAEDQPEPEPEPEPPYARRRAGDKHRRKDTRSWENIIKNTSHFPHEERMAHIEGKYNEMLDELKRTSYQISVLTKQSVALGKDRDHARSDLTKMIIGRSRLENLCRELQKQNKQIKDENMAKMKEEEDRRRETCASLNEKLLSLNGMMEENRTQNDRLRDENIQMTERLSQLYSEFQKRENNAATVLHQLELERELAKAVHAKLELELQQERENFARERALMVANVAKSEKNCQVLSETVSDLQKHINVYKTQYEGFESAISKSSKIFDNFKSEMTALNKKMKHMEVETNAWKKKFHDSMAAMVDMTEAKVKQDAIFAAVEKKNEQLQKLCRQLQADRTSYHGLLKTNNIEVPETAVVVEKKEPAAKEVPVSKEVVTAKEIELKALKENLKELELQFNEQLVQANTNKKNGKKATRGMEQTN